MKILNFLNLTSQNGMIPTINEPTMVSLEKKKKKKSSFETENKSKYFQNELQSFNYLINRSIYLGLDDKVL